MHIQDELGNRAFVVDAIWTEDHMTRDVLIQRVHHGQAGRQFLALEHTEGDNDAGREASDANGAKDAEYGGPQEHHLGKKLANGRPAAKTMDRDLGAAVRVEHGRRNGTSVMVMARCSVAETLTCVGTREPHQSTSSVVHNNWIARVTRPYR